MFPNDYDRRLVCGFQQALGVSVTYSFSIRAHMLEDGMGHCGCVICALRCVVIRQEVVCFLQWKTLLWIVLMTRLVPSSALNAANHRLFIFFVRLIVQQALPFWDS